MFTSRLSPIAPDLWQVERPLRMPGGAILPCRSVLARLTDGSLWLWSPVQLDETADEIRALGAVRHVVAPNQFHHIQFPGTAALFPGARTWACPGLKAKRPDIAFTDELASVPPAAWSDVLDQVLIAGMPKCQEIAFLHKPTRTLILADLVFHILEPQGFGLKLVTRLFGTYRRLGVSRLFRFFIADRAAVAASVRRILDWDFDRLVPGHGAILETGAKAALTRALEPLQAARR